MPRIRKLGLALLAAGLATQAAHAKKPRARHSGQRPEVVVQAGARLDTSGKPEGFTDFVISADGRLLAAAGPPGVQIFETDSGLLVRGLTFENIVEKMAFSDDGALLVVSNASTFVVWEVETGRLVKRFQLGPQEISQSTLHFLDRGRLVFTVETWRNGEKLPLKPITVDVRTGKRGPPPAGMKTGEEFFARDPKGRFWVRAANYLALIDPKTSKRGRTLEIDQYDMISFDAGFDRYATRKHDGGDLSVVETKSGAVIRSFALPKGAGLSAPYFTADGKRLIANVAHEIRDRRNVIVSPENYIYTWSLETGEAETPRKIPFGGAIAPGGRVLIGQGRFLDISTGQPIRRQLGGLASLWRLSFSPDGRRLLASEDETYRGDDQGRVRVWDLVSGRLVQTIAATAAQYNADGTAILVGAYKQAASLIDARTLQPINKLLRGSWETHINTGASFSPDGKLLAVGDVNIDILELPSGAPLAKAFGGTTFGGRMPQFNADGKLLASYLGPQVVVHDTSTWKTVAFCGNTFMQKYVDALAISPDGSLVAVGKERNTNSFIDRTEVRIYETATCKERRLIQLPDDGAMGQLAFSPDGKRLIAATGFLHVWDVESGAEVPLGHPDGRAVAFRPGHPEQIAVASWGKIILWDLERRTPVATFYCFDGEWLTLLPDNRYAASRGALSHLAFRIGARAFPFEQFDLRFNRPDAVLEALGAAPARIEAARASVRKRLKRSGFTEEQLSGELQLPEVQLLSQPPPSTKERNLEVTVRAEGASALLDRLLVTVNDVPLGGSAGIDWKEKKSRALTEKVSIPLSIGKNLIQISVLNARGVESLRRSFETIFDAPAKKPDLYVVAVGVSIYKDTDKSLRYAAKDAGDLAAFFEKKRSAFNGVKILKLLDGDAIKEKIAAASEFLKPSTVDDEAVVFFAGHGLRDEKLDYYFATADVDFENPSARGLPYEEIEKLLDGIGARRKLLLIDTCNSGELDKDEATLVASNETKTSEGVIKSRGVKVVQTKAPPLGLEGNADLLEDLFADVRRGSGAVAIASAGGAEFALESDAWKNGVFTYSLLSTLGGGKVRVSEVRDAVTAKVKELTAGKQRPTARSENLNFDFAIY